MITKAKIINEAFEDLRIWGITTSPSPSEVTSALYRLEAMMASYEATDNLTLGYNFEENPNINSNSGLSLSFKRFAVKNLAVELIPPYNKEVPIELKAQAAVSFEATLGVVQANKLQMIQPPRRMPMGNGNTFRGLFWNRYMIPVPLAPNVPETNYITQGEQFNYSEDFSAWLGSNTIASFTIVCDPLLTIVTSANADPQITYTITAPSNVSGYGPYQQVMITVTDSIGRVDIRLINFTVITPPNVGS